MKNNKEIINLFRKGVDEFHRTFQCNGLSKIEDVEAFIELRTELFMEEAKEYTDAGHDIIEKADAITDMLYIAIGTLDLVNKSVEEVQYHINDEYTGILTEPLQLAFSLLDKPEDVLIKLKIEGLYQTVQNSNMSKLDNLGRPIINGVSIYDGENKTNYDIEHVIGEPVFVKSKPKGKIIKSENFFEPNISNALNS